MPILRPRKLPAALQRSCPHVVTITRYLSCTSQNLSDADKGVHVNTYDSSMHCPALTRIPDKRPSEDNKTPRKEEERGQATLENNKQLKSEKAKSISQADEELRERLEQMSGGGGASGIEYEDGQPNTMKRSVRNNMFRYI